MRESQYPEYITTEHEAHQFIHEFPYTEIVSVVGLGITHLEWLSALPYLHTLYVQGFYHSGNRPEQEDTVSDFSGIRGIPNLQNLSIHDCRHFRDHELTILADVSTLTRISLSSFMHTITDITPLSRLPNLAEVDLSGYWRQERQNTIAQRCLGFFADSFEQQAQEIQRRLPACRIMLRQPGQESPYPSEFWGKTIPQNSQTSCSE